MMVCHGSQANGKKIKLAQPVVRQLGMEDVVETVMGALTCKPVVV